MTSKPKHSEFTPIGVDIRHEAVFAVQFVKNGEGYKVHRALAQPIYRNGAADEATEAVEAALKRIFDAGRFVGNKVVSALPSADVDTRPIVLPTGTSPADGARFAEALYIEARSCLLYAPEDAVLNYLTMSAGPKGGDGPAEVLLIACRKDSAQSHIALIESAGMKCAHVDSAACAAVRMLGETDEVFAVIALDHSQCLISVGRGRGLLFSRRIKLGVDRFVQAIVTALDIDEVQAWRMLRVTGIDHKGPYDVDLDGLTQTGAAEKESIAAGLFACCRSELENFGAELRRSFHYFTGLRSAVEIQKAFVIGTVLPTGLEAFLTDRLKLPVTTGAALPLDAVDTEDGGTDGSFVQAAGLALREVLE